MKFFNLPPQIFRLVLLIFSIVIIYLVARTLLTPDSFREYAFYRGAALVEQAARTPVFSGKNACGARHPDILKTVTKGGHKTLSCEGCHGVVTKDQLARPDHQMSKPTDQVCLRCHESNPSRPEWFRQIEVKEHYSEKCIECHLPHEPNEVK